MGAFVVIVSILLASAIPDDTAVVFRNEVTVVGMLIDYIPVQDYRGLQDAFWVGVRSGPRRFAAIPCFVRKDDITILRALAFPGQTILRIGGHLGYKKMRYETRMILGIFVHDWIIVQR